MGWRPGAGIRDNHEPTKTGETPASSDDMLAAAHKMLSGGTAPTSSEDLIEQARRATQIESATSPLPTSSRTDHSAHSMQKSSTVRPAPDVAMEPPPHLPHELAPELRHRLPTQSTPPERPRRSSRGPAPIGTPTPAAPDPTAVRSVRRVFRLVGVFVFLAIIISSVGGFFSDDSSDDVVTVQQDPTAQVASFDAVQMVESDILLSSDIEGGLEVAADGVTIDCDGYSITGNGTGVGVTVDAHNSVTITNCNVSGFSVGIGLSSASQSNLADNVVAGNTVGLLIQGGSNDNRVINTRATGNTDTGILVDGSHRNLITGSLITGSQRGLLLANAEGNRVLSNQVEGALEGFAYGLAAGSSGNTVRSNTATSNGTGFAVFDGSNQNAFVANEAAGNEFGFVVLADPGTAENQFMANSTTANTNLGFIDETRDIGSTATMNTYANNTCTDGADPTGLCLPPLPEANA